MNEKIDNEPWSKERIREEREKVEAEVDAEINALGIESDKFYIDLRPSNTGWPVRQKELFGPFDSKKEAKSWLRKIDFQPQDRLPLLEASIYKNYWHIQAVISRGAKGLKHLLLPPNYSKDHVYEGVKSPDAILDDSIFKEKIELAPVLPSGEDGEFFSRLSEICTREKGKHDRSIVKFYDLSPEEGLKMAQEYLYGAQNSARNSRSELGYWESASNIAIAKVLVAFFTVKIKGIRLPSLPEKPEGALMDNIKYLEDWADSVISQSKQ